MISFPNCKINLGLHVVERRPDGYHNLETLFVPVPLCDELEIVSSDEFSFVQEGIPIGGNIEENLCVKAYRALQADFPQVQPVEMRLVKHIPFGAGLGGGSSDAAFTLKMVAQLFELPCTTADMEHYASRLGADCPFFVANQVSYATGIGDQLEHISLDFSCYRLVMLKPDDAVSTAEAYRGVVPRMCHNKPDLRQAVRRPISDWRTLIVNDFENSVFPGHPRIAQLKEFLYQSGALYASMSGSGAALYAFFPPRDSVNFSTLPTKEIIFDSATAAKSSIAPTQ